MKPKLETYKLKDWTVLGRTEFQPPRKINDALVNEARIVHVIHGKSILHSAEQRLELFTGDTMIMKADNFVNTWLENGDGQMNKVVVFQLSAEFLQFLYGSQLPAWLVPEKGQNFKSVEKAPRSGILDAYFKSLGSYLDSSAYFTEEILGIKIKELVSILVQTDRNGDIERIFANLFSSREFDFQKVIQEHLFDDLNVEDLAFLTSMSLSSFKRKFSGVFGTSPNKYIISKRLEKAQTLLSTTDLRVSEIAYECGFSDVSHFSKSFRTYYNMSPSDLRKDLLD